MPMRSRNRNRLKKITTHLGLILFGTFLALLLFEVLVRIFSPSQVPWQRHEILGHSHVPGKRGIYRNKGFSAPFQFNSEGWRDREYPFEKAEGTFRIIVLGDSFTEALQLPVEQSFPKLLEARLNRDGSRPFEVINMGVGAFSTDQQYLALKHFGARYHPDLVLLAFCVENDIYGNLLELRGDPLKPYFVVDEMGRLVQTNFVLPPNEKIRNFLRNHLTSYMFLKKRLATMSRLSSFLLKLGILRDTQYLRRDEHGVFIDYSTHIDRYPPEWEKAWEITKALLLTIRKEASRRDAGFLLVLINYDVLVHDDLWQEALRTYPSMRDVAWDLGKANRLINEFCALHHIECLDLLATFRDEAARTGERLYLPEDGHWSQRGHELATTSIYRRIVDTGLAPPP
jgi:hypothetical protein